VSDEGTTIVVDAEGDATPGLDPETGTVTIEHDDGSITIGPDEDDSVERQEETDENFYRNLALELDGSTLGLIADDLLEGIDSDIASRKDWLEQRAEIIAMLGLKLEEPRGDLSASAAPLEGMSVVNHPLLLEAVLRFQANARGELLPAEGPVKVSVDSEADSTGTQSTLPGDTQPALDSDNLAETLEEQFNYYLTVTASEYYPDTDRMLFLLGAGGTMFKKVYRCPIRRRPVSESVDAEHIIVSNNATDLKNALRVTHHIRNMSKTTLKRMQLLGVYRDIMLGDQTGPEITAVDQVKAEQQGTDPNATRPEDQNPDLYECYCSLDIPGFEDTDDKGNATGLLLPYRVTIHRESKQILAIVRNWEQGDDDKIAREVFVKYPFVPGLGFWDIGLGHILGNTTRALSAMWRIAIDNGMFANFPGGLIAKSAVRQNSNEMRIPPGGFQPIETSDKDIRSLVTELPYRDVSPAFLSLIQGVTETGQRVGGTAELQVGEGRQDAPVGTTLALIEQATKVMDAVHKRIHAAQAKEFQLLKELFRQNPQDIIRGRKGALEAWNEDEFKAALERADITPRADPNTPSHMHRLMKAMNLLQMAQMAPQLFNTYEVATYVLRILGIENIDKILVPPQPVAPAPPPLADVAKMIAAQAQLGRNQVASEKNQLQAAQLAADNQHRDADRDADLQKASLNVAKELIVHPESAPIVENTLGPLKPPTQ
jgi:hypothetical protein